MDFRERNFTNPMVRLLATNVKTKGSYTFEVFAYEGQNLRQFNLRFLPDKDFFLINFIKKSDRITSESEEVKNIISRVEKLYFSYRSDRTGKISIEELTVNFLTLLVDNQPADIPKDILTTLKGEIIRIFKNTDVCKLDKKGRPYFASARFGKFFITDIGAINPEDFARNGLVSH